MNINITEDTRIHQGKLKIGRAKRKFTAVINSTARGYDVDVLVLNSFGSIIDSFSRNISNEECDGYSYRAINAAIREWEADQA